MSDVTPTPLLTLTIQQAPSDSPLSAGQAFSVPAGAAVIGRSPDADVVLPDPTVSRRHLRLSVDGDELVIERLTRSNGLFLDGRDISQEARTTAANAQLQVGGLLLGVMRQAETRPVRENIIQPDIPTEAQVSPMFSVRWDADRCTIDVGGRLLNLTPSAARALGALLATPGEPVHAWDIQERIGEGNANLSQLYSLVRNEISAIIDDGVVAEAALRERVEERIGEAATDRAGLMRQFIRSRRGYGYLICLRGDDVTVEHL